MKITVRNGNIVFEDSFSSKERIKTIPGRSWKQKEKVWTLPYTIDNIELVNAMFNAHLNKPQIKTRAKNVMAVEDPHIKNLYTHQRVSVAVGRQTDAFADMSEPGTGKTLVQIELMLERDVWPALIVCPKSIMEAVWVTQINEIRNKYDGWLTPVMFDKGSAFIKTALKYLKTHEDKFDSKYYKGFIYILNYEMVPLVLEELLKIPWQYIICDESTKIKNPKAIRSKAVIKLRDKAKYRSIMTGTIAPNGLIDIFNQFKFIQPLIFGDLFYAFRSKYFYNGGFENKEWFPRPESMDIVKEKIEKISIQHFKRDCIDLPPLVEEKRYVELTGQQKQHYTNLKEQFITFLNETEVVTAPYAITRMMKLRQVCSGFVYMEDRAFPIKNNKETELLSLLEELEDKQIIIFAHFTETINHVQKLLAQNKKSVATFYGKINEQLKQANLKDFENGSIQYLIANPASAGHGLNLQFCSNIIYYELDFNLENFLQSMQRIERIGQKNKMTVYYLLVKNTLETYVLRKLRSKQNLNKQLDIKELKEQL